MKKAILSLAALLLLTTPFLPVSHAQAFPTQDTVGTWTFFVTIAGAPPCQCIQLLRLRADGTLECPGNDHFSSTALGDWKKTGFRDVTFAFVQNSINADGSAGGEYLIRGIMTLNAAADQGTGTSTFQLIDNGGKVMESVTATFRASKLKLD